MPRELPELLRSLTVLVQEATQTVRMVRAALERLSWFSIQAGGTSMGNLIQTLLKESFEIIKAYREKNARDILIHLCHVVCAVAVATPTLIDDQLAAICEKAINNPEVLDFLAGYLERILFRNEQVESFGVPEPMIAAGISPEMIAKLIELAMWAIKVIVDLFDETGPVPPVVVVDLNDESDSEDE